MSDELIQRVLKVIATSKRIPLQTVTIESDFQQLGIDSMDAVEILFALENEFDISIPDDEVRGVRNVRQMSEGVEKLIAAKADGAKAGQ
jgi:acyl carrier protein